MDKYGPLAQVPYQINGQTYKTYNASLPFVGVSSGNNYNLDFNNPAHRDVTRFWNQGVLDVWKHFRDKVKQHSNFPVEYFVADMFNEQGIRWLFNAGTMHKAMELCDVWYHTYNHSPGDWGHNLVGTDVLHGTFGTGKASAIEYDSFDAGAGGSGGWINTEHLKKSIVKFLEGGGKKIHWAMNWNANQINQIGEVIRWVKDNYINNPNWIPAYIKARPTGSYGDSEHTDMFYNSAYIDKAWQSTGNSLNSPFSANIINIQVVDTFWTIPKP